MTLFGVAWYVLNKDGSVRRGTQEEGIEQFQGQNRQIARTQLADDVLISTVFLVFDHSYPEDPERPIVFETMIFGGERDGLMLRADSIGGALGNHARASAEVGLAVPRPGGGFTVEFALSENLIVR